MKANAAFEWSNIPIAAPIDNVIASHIPNFTSFWCADTVYRMFCFADIFQGVVVYDVSMEVVLTTVIIMLGVLE